MHHLRGSHPPMVVDMAGLLRAVRRRHDPSRGGHVTDDDETVLTELPDLAGVTLADLRRLDLAEEQERVVRQVERPRVNLGGNGPPGRAD